MKRTYAPKGFVCSVPRHAAPSWALTGDSKNWLLDPTEEKCVRRKGQTTPSGWSTLFSDSGTSFTSRPRCRRISGITARQLASKAKVAAAMYTRETGLTEREGGLCVFDSDQSDWYDLGQEYSTTHYPATGLAAPNWRWIPLWRNDSSTGQPFRGVSAANRRKILGGGGRDFFESGEWLFSQSEGVPYMWRKAWNFATNAGSNVNHVRPWGHYPPLFHPYVEAKSGTSSVRSWKANVGFYYSVLFLNEDGSATPAILPSDDVANTHGTATIGAGGRYVIPSSSAYWEYVEWTCIPRGPRGTVARVLLRSPSYDTTSSTTSGVIASAIADMRVIAVLNNNTQTTYRDYRGNDDNLTIAPEYVTVQHMWPKRARYLAGNDSRFALGGAVKVNPGAIILAPVSSTATARDLNAVSNAHPDDSSGVASRWFYYEISATALVLYMWNGGALTTKTLNFVTYTTLEQLVNAVNQTKHSADSQEWCASLAPGADGTVATATSLAITTGAAAQCGDATRQGIPNANCVWVRGPWEPAVLYFDRSYLDRYPADDQVVYFTKGGPDAVKSAPLAWAPYNQTKPPSNACGRMQGIGGVKNRFIVAYENAIYRIENTKTGEDRDVRMFPVNESRGCISPSSFAVGPGVVGYMTHVGYVITDGEREVVLSRAIWQKRKKIGEWAVEMAATKKSNAADTDDSFFAAAFLGDELHIAYRKNTGLSSCDRRLVYDYSANAIVTGVDGLLDPETRQPFGWSAPLTTTVTVMAEIADASNEEVRYGSVEDVAAGRIDKFDTGSSDNGSAIAADAYLRTDFLDTLDLKELGNGRIMYTAADGGVSVIVYRDSGRADSFTTTLASTSSSVFARAPVDLTPEARTPTDVVEVLIRDDGSGATAPEFWQFELDYTPKPGYPR